MLHESTALAPLGDSSDPQLLADVLAFLDSFDEDAAAEAAAQDPPRSRGFGRAYGSTASGSSRRRRSTAKPENRKRVALYWEVKDEVQGLRSAVEYLSNVLAHAKESAATRPCAETIARWKLRVRIEREQRRRAEETNAQLRRLARCQIQCSRRMDAMLNEAWWGTWEYYLGCPFAGASASGQSERLSLASMRAARAAVAESSHAWTTRFSLQPTDSHRIVDAWWAAVHKLHASDRRMLCQGSGVRVEREISWYIWDDAGQQIPFNGVVAFELRQSNSRWELVVTADVYATPGTALLFRTFAVLNVTLASAASPNTREFQARYSVEFPSDSSCASQHSRANDAHMKDIGVKTWAGVMRQKDAHLRMLVGMPNTASISV